MKLKILCWQRTALDEDALEGISNVASLCASQPVNRSESLFPACFVGVRDYLTITWQAVDEDAFAAFTLVADATLCDVSGLLSVTLLRGICRDGQRSLKARTLC